MTPANFSVLVLLSLLLSGCIKVGPDYIPPAPAVPTEWQQGNQPSYLQHQGDLSEWWNLFSDPLLTRLISEALANNHDLKLALLRMDEARTAVAIAYSAYFPLGETSTSVEWGKASKQLSPGARSFRSQTAANLNVSWELDLFGRIARSMEAATADLETSEEGKNAVLVSLVAQTATSYILLRTTQANLDVAIRNIEAQKSILDLTKTREASGLASGLDVAQAERVLASSEADVPPLRARLVQTLNAIALLLGKQPGYLAGDLSKVQPLPAPPLQTLVGVPADIIRQRPDIRQAERILAAETARIGVARADLYPTLSLTGVFGFGALRFSDIWGNSFGYSAGPGFLWTAFDGGRIRAQIAQQELRAQEAYVQYEQTVLNALSEVENALKNYVEEQVRVEALARSVEASKKTLQLASDLYRDGLADFQNVLDAETALFTNESLLTSARGNAVTNFVTLYRALGGGWQPPAGGDATNAHTVTGVTAPVSQ